MINTFILRERNMALCRNLKFLKGHPSHSRLSRWRSIGTGIMKRARGHHGIKDSGHDRHNQFATLNYSSAAAREHEGKLVIVFFSLRAIIPREILPRDSATVLLRPQSNSMQSLLPLSPLHRPFFSRSLLLSTSSLPAAPSRQYINNDSYTRTL